MTLAGWRKTLKLHQHFYLIIPELSPKNFGVSEFVCFVTCVRVYLLSNEKKIRSIDLSNVEQDLYDVITFSSQ